MLSRFLCRSLETACLWFGPLKLFWKWPLSLAGAEVTASAFRWEPALSEGRAGNVRVSSRPAG